MIIQHAECEPPGTIGDVISERGLVPQIVRTDLGENVPLSADNMDGLIIMGGSMAVYEQDQFPFLSHEIALIKSAVQQGIPILGICLGGQLVSEALGGKVYKGEKQEIGWHPIYITADAADDPLLRQLETFKAPASQNFCGFSWHGDYFTLPERAVRLAYSDACEFHAIRFGSNVYALQWHPEISGGTIDIWLDEFETDFNATGLDVHALLDDTVRLAGFQRRAAKQIGNRWVDLVLDGATSRDAS